MSSITLSYGFALLVGLVVSLDVGGLLISQYRDFSRDNIFTYALKIAALHAVTHSLLFLGYFYIVSGLVELPLEFITWLSEKFSNILPDVAINEAAKTTSLLSAIIIVIFVWITYAEKIIEDHTVKFQIKDNHVEGLRIDIRLTFGIVKLVRSIFKGRASLKLLLNVALALAVAVDMLAITSFIRVFFSISPDAANLDGRATDTLRHLDFGVGSEQDPFIFALIIFVSVFISSCIAITFAKTISNESQEAEKHTNNRNKYVLRCIRVGEPFFVFWFLIVSLDHLFGNSVSGLHEFWLKIGNGFLIAAFLTCLLVFSHGPQKIWNSISNGMGVSAEGVVDPEAAITDKTLIKQLWKALGVFLAILFLVVIVFFISHKPGISDGEGVKEFLKILSSIASILALLWLFIPIRWVAEKEFEFSRLFLAKNVIEWTAGIRIIFFSLVAYFVILFYMKFSFSVAKEVSFNFITPLLYLGFLFAFTLLFLVLRRLRVFFFKDERGLFFCITMSDILTAFALTIVGWQSLTVIFN